MTAPHTPNNLTPAEAYASRLDNPRGDNWFQRNLTKGHQPRPDQLEARANLVEDATERTMGRHTVSGLDEADHEGLALAAKKTVDTDVLDAFVGNGTPGRKGYYEERFSRRGNRLKRTLSTAAFVAAGLGSGAVETVAFSGPFWLAAAVASTGAAIGAARLTATAVPTPEEYRSLLAEHAPKKPITVTGSDGKPRVVDIEGKIVDSTVTSLHDLRFDRPLEVNPMVAQKRAEVASKQKELDEASANPTPVSSLIIPGRAPQVDPVARLTAELQRLQGELAAAEQTDRPIALQNKLNGIAAAATMLAGGIPAEKVDSNSSSKKIHQQGVRGVYQRLSETIRNPGHDPVLDLTASGVVTVDQNGYVTNTDYAKLLEFVRARRSPGYDPEQELLSVGAVQKDPAGNPIINHPWLQAHLRRNPGPNSDQKLIDLGIVRKDANGTVVDVNNERLLEYLRGRTAAELMMLGGDQARAEALQRMRHGESKRMSKWVKVGGFVLALATGAMVTSSLLAKEAHGGTDTGPSTTVPAPPASSGLLAPRGTTAPGSTYAPPTMTFEMPNGTQVTATTPTAPTTTP